MTDPMLLTDAELELMHQLWDHGPSTARQVHDALPPRQTRAYTTFATILQILVDKGFARAEKQGRAFLYHPTLSRADYEARNLRQVVQDVFRGDAVGLVRALVVAEDLAPYEVDALRRLVDGLPR